MRLLIALPALSFVSASLAAAGSAAQPTPESPYVELRRIEAGTWRATYHLDASVSALRFQRPAAFYREGVWRVMTPGYELTRDGDWQLLALAAGAEPRAEITVEFPEHTENIPKEYELFQPFSSGAVAIYTGHLYAAPVDDAAPDGADSEVDGSDDDGTIRTLRIVPPAGAHAVVRGGVKRGPFKWTDEIGDGTYVYMGRAEPIETPHIIAVVDPGMPAWLRERLDRYLPRLFRAYSARLDLALPWKPLVLYSFQDREGAGYEFGGGTLTGLIQMTLTGSAWRQPGPEAEEQVVHLLAHEAAHLWNGQLVSNPGGGAAWMHEGAADALAEELLLEFGVVDSATHRRRIERAINGCALGVVEGPVSQAHRRGAFRTFYDCGHVMALWTAGAAAGADPGTDLFGFWRRLLAVGLERDGAYDEELYFEVLAELGVGEDVRSEMRQFLSGPNAMARAVRGLSDAGLPVEAGQGTPPDDVQRELARKAMTHVMAQACGNFSFWSEPDAFRTAPMPECVGFEREMHVGRIEGASVAGEGAAVYERVRQRCGAGGEVSLQAADGARLASLRCDAELPAPPKWYVLGS